MPNEPTVEVKADTIFKALFDHHMAQDRLVWDQVRTILTLQGAVIAAAFVMRGSIYAAIPPVIGIIFTAIIFLFVIKARHDRDFNLDNIETLVKTLSSKETQGALKAKDGDERLIRTGSKLGGKRIKWRGWNFPLISGHSLYLTAFWLCIALDIAAIPIFYVMQPSRPETVVSSTAPDSCWDLWLPGKGGFCPAGR